MAAKELALGLAQEAETYRLLKNYQLANLRFTDAINIAPNYAWAFAHRGATRRDMAGAGSPNPQSEADFRRAIELKEDYAWAWANLGAFQNKMNQYENALESFDQAIAINNTYAWARAHKGRSLYLLGQYDKAENSLTEAIDGNGQYAFAFALRAAVRARLAQENEGDRQFKKAMHYYQQAMYDVLAAIAIDNTIFDNPSTQSNLTQLLDTRSDLKELLSRSS